jgi:hypothetical protein
MEPPLPSIHLISTTAHLPLQGELYLAERCALSPHWKNSGKAGNMGEVTSQTSIRLYVLSAGAQTRKARRDEL